ncbi:unnamed protein product [Rotaria socialis]
MTNFLLVYDYNRFSIDFNPISTLNFSAWDNTDSQLVVDPSPALFPHSGAIGIETTPVAFTGRTIEREGITTTIVEPPKRVSKFKASRHQQ